MNPEEQKPLWIGVRSYIQSSAELALRTREMIEIYLETSRALLKYEPQKVESIEKKAVKTCDGITALLADMTSESASLATLIKPNPGGDDDGEEGEDNQDRVWRG